MKNRREIIFGKASEITFSKPDKGDRMSVEFHKVKPIGMRRGG